MEETSGLVLWMLHLDPLTCFSELCKFRIGNKCNNSCPSIKLMDFIAALLCNLKDWSKVQEIRNTMKMFQYRGRNERCLFFWCLTGKGLREEEQLRLKEVILDFFMMVVALSQFQHYYLQIQLRGIGDWRKGMHWTNE